MTTKQQAKLTAIRAEAEAHGDDKTVALVDAALAGDAASMTRLGIAEKAVRAVATGAASRAPTRTRSRNYGAQIVHPFAHDEE